ncbi:MAG: tRNA (adenosine(37)-N6)-dimethylallyltransferase MiaA [Candidatus Pacebacteria bacterium]|nr:tRNA (adenosine(37)-N6)-dimethylallyltransferase MiaA [Candidatus Paceibacterota bacterium]
MADYLRILAIVGPTAVGKTAYGIRAALEQNGEVISADSRQVYRGLDLGTGKVTYSEMQGVPHHLIDVCEPEVQFTVHDFVRLGRAAIDDIRARGKLPIVVGGTGLYVDALLGRVPLNAPPVDPTLRERLSRYSDDELRAELSVRNPILYAQTDRANRRRVQRALEIALSETKPVPVEHPPYSVTWVGLTLPREALKERILKRLDERLAVGMLDEARTLHAAGLSFERMENLGLEYRFMARHLMGQLSYEDMRAQLGTEIFKYAKRQLTWFKRNGEIRWDVPPTGPGQV